MARSIIALAAASLASSLTVSFAEDPIIDVSLDVILPTTRTNDSPGPFSEEDPRFICTRALVSLDACAATAEKEHAAYKLPRIKKDLEKRHIALSI